MLLQAVGVAALLAVFSASANLLNQPTPQNSVAMPIRAAIPCEPINEFRKAQRACPKETQSD